MKGRTQGERDVVDEIDEQWTRLVLSGRALDATHSMIMSGSTNDYKSMPCLV